MLPRFFAPALDPSRADVDLPPDEARHLCRVLRLRAGDEVAVFDGRGREFRARVTHAVRDRVRLALVEATAPAAESRIPLTLVQAVLKADSMDSVVRDATVLGVRAIVPVLTAHLAVSTKGLESGKAAGRWHRVALAAAKQSRRATLPEIATVQALDQWLSSCVAGLRLLLAEPSAACHPRPLRELMEGPLPASLALAIGPEGGWEAGEVARCLAAGCVPVSLGALTLRAETAPVVALSMCRAVFDL